MGEFLTDFGAISDRLDDISRKIGESGEKKKAPEGKWAVLLPLGTFVLYLFGYLTLRFHLSAFGVGTDLAVLDERYLFAGAQFLVYLVASIPVLALLAAPFALLLVLLRRTWPGIFADVAERTTGLLLVATVFSIVWIQLAPRQCFQFSNLLVASNLPQPEWMARWILLDREGGIQQIYFAVSLGAGLGTVLLWHLARRREGGRWSAGSVLVAALAAVQFLFLPVTFGVLIADQDAPRVTSLNGKDPLPPGQAAWRIWEGKDGVVFLTAPADSKSGTGGTRALVTIDKKEIKKTEITGYDRILNVLFEGNR